MIQFALNVNYGRDVIRNHTEGVNHYNLIDLIKSENLTSSSIINSIQLVATNRSTNKKLNLRPKLQYLSSFQRTSCDNSSRDVSLFSLNCRSVKNKALSVCDSILSNKVDIFALTETWLGSSVDKSVISELKPDGYSIHHVSRQSQRGCGVAIVFNSDLKVEQFQMRFNLHILKN